MRKCLLCSDMDYLYLYWERDKRERLATTPFLTLLSNMQYPIWMLLESGILIILQSFPNQDLAHIPPEHAPVLPIFQSRLCTDLDYTYLGLRRPPPFAISLTHNFNRVWWWSISAE